jgi:glycosyltransferase involved in cell wall biosynthesis
VGQVPPAELQALLARAHLFVSAASYEAFGISTIEAMSSATLPVVTPVGVHPEVVREGETGFLLDPGDDGRAVETLRRALALEPTALARIGAAARAAARRFAWETVVHEYLDVYAAAVEAFPAASARL